MGVVEWWGYWSYWSSGVIEVVEWRGGGVIEVVKLLEYYPSTRLFPYPTSPLAVKI